MAGIGKLTMWVGGAGLVWNLIGVVAFVGQMRIDTGKLPDAQRAFHDTMPLWAKGAFFIAVSMGTLGCIGLLTGQPWARWAFAASLAGILAQNFHAFVLGNGLEAFGVGGAMFPLLVFLIGLGLLAFSVLA